MHIHTDNNAWDFLKIIIHSYSNINYTYSLSIVNIWIDYSLYIYHEYEPEVAITIYETFH